jgi:putative transposase
MRRAGLQGVTGRPKFRRDCDPRRPPATWSTASSLAPARSAVVTDITEHPTREGKLYCAVVLDACSRRWSAGPSTPPRRWRW